MLSPRLILPALLLMLCTTAAHAQTDSTRAPQAVRPSDSLTSPTSPTVRQSDGPTVRSSDSTTFRMAKSPLGAVLRSAIIPGLGQAYNESWWKVPVVVGLSAFLIRGFIVENSSYRDYADKYAATITKDVPAGDLRLKLFREFYRDRRDTYAWWFVVTYLIQIADAYVDAHLYDFDVSPEVKASLVLAPGAVHFALRW